MWGEPFPVEINGGTASVSMLYAGTSLPGIHFGMSLQGTWQCVKNDDAIWADGCSEVL